MLPKSTPRLYKDESRNRRFFGYNSIPIIWGLQRAGKLVRQTKTPVKSRTGRIMGHCLDIVYVPVLKYIRYLLYQISVKWLILRLSRAASSRRVASRFFHRWHPAEFMVSGVLLWWYLVQVHFQWRKQHVNHRDLLFVVPAIPPCCLDIKKQLRSSVASYIARSYYSCRLNFSNPLGLPF